MHNPEKTPKDTITTRRIFGNGIKQTEFPGVDKAWIFNLDTQNYEPAKGPIKKSSNLGQ